jgi:Zn-dependent protease
MVIIQFIFFILILLMSVVIHEVSHGYAAYLQGDMTAKYQGRLTLNPLKHIDPIGSIIVPIVTSFLGFPFGWAKPVPFNPYNLRNQRWGELLVAAAGPAANIIIAIFFGVIVRLALFTAPSSSFVYISAWVIWINICLAVFNLIPIPPLDGSKILFSFLPYHWSRIRWQIERYSLILVFILILIPIFSTALGITGFFLTQHLSGISPALLTNYLSVLP